MVETESCEKGFESVLSKGKMDTVEIPNGIPSSVASPSPRQHTAGFHNPAQMKKRLSVNAGAPCSFVARIAGTARPGVRDPDRNHGTQPRGPGVLTLWREHVITNRWRTHVVTRPRKKVS